MKLHHVQLAIPPGSEDECRSFYLDVLKFDEIPKPAELAKRGGLWMKSGQVEIHLGVEQDFRPAQKAHPAFHTDRLVEIAADLEKHDYQLLWDDSIPKWKRFFVFDAVGNRLEFMQGS